ncbi:MAG TPA: HlyD family efflux transporter periplasmic adaptor subunit [Gemmata sp.]
MPNARRTGRTLTTLLAGLVALAVGVAGGYWVGGRGPNAAVPSEGPNGPTSADRVVALGRLQPEGGVVPVYGPPGDRIAKLYPVAVGRALAAGAPVAELASRKDRLLEVQVAKTQLAEATAARNAAKRAGEKKIAAAQAELDQAKANKVSDLTAIDAKLKAVGLQAKTAAKQVERLKSLNTAAEDVERVELLKAQADAELAATQATRDKTQTTYEETEKAAAARIEAARAELDEALARAPIRSSEERVQLAEQVAEQTIIKAPVAGVVLKVNGHEGQPTGTEPILQLADLSKMTAVAEVYESDVERLAGWVRGGPVAAEVTNPALPKPLTGAVRSEADITRMIARNQVFAMGPREDADRRVVEVVVHLDAASAADAGRFVGLQVTVTFAARK